MSVPGTLLRKDKGEGDREPSIWLYQSCLTILIAFYDKMTGFVNKERALALKSFLTLSPTVVLYPTLVIVIWMGR